MPEYHEIKVFKIHKEEPVDIIYIHDDFFCYISEKYPSLSKFMGRIPVFYPGNLEYPGDLSKFQQRKPPERGISLYGISILNSSTFDELLQLTNQLQDAAENLDDETLQEFDYSFTKEETIDNLKKLVSILENIIANKKEYILTWEGI